MGVVVHVLRHLKEEGTWTTDKWLQVISNKMLFYTVIPVRMMHLTLKIMM